MAGQDPRNDRPLPHRRETRRVAGCASEVGHSHEWCMNVNISSFYRFYMCFVFFFFSMVSSYLVHHGYCATATAFARATETTIQEDQMSIKNRQSESWQQWSCLCDMSVVHVQSSYCFILFCLIGIQKLVLAGRVGEAIEATQQLYPGLLDHNPNLLFMLK